MRKDTSSIPDFIIAGFMKSGTSTLLHHLRNHRKIHLPANEGFEYSVEVKNKTVLPRYPITLYVGHKLGLINHPKVKNMLLSLNFKNKQPGYRKMSVETQKELKSYFHQHNKKLEHLINMDLSIWDQ